MRDKSESSAPRVERRSSHDKDVIAFIEPIPGTSSAEPHLNALIGGNERVGTLEVLRFLGIEPEDHAVALLDDSGHFVASPL